MERATCCAKRVFQPPRLSLFSGIWPRHIHPSRCLLSCLLSEPNLPQTMTLSEPRRSHPLSPFHTSKCSKRKVFHVDADDDIVVGDTIIFTERLYVDRDGNLLVSGGGTTSSNNILVQSRRSHPSYRQDFPAASSGAGCGSAPRVSLSMASLEYQTTKQGDRTERRRSTAGRRPSTAASLVVPVAAGSIGGGEEFVGERTAAAHVLQDSFRSMRRKERGGVLEYDR